MSLDVTLIRPDRATEPCMYCDGTGRTVCEDDYFSANITHNLGNMAGEAGIYQHLWRPEEIGITKAGELIEPLTKGLALMRLNPKHFEKLNPSNGWGRYEDFVPWIQEYLDACIENPDAEIAVSR